MVDGVMNEDAPKRMSRPGPSEMQRRQRKKNLVVLGLLAAFVVLVYFVTIVRMSGG